MFNNFEQFMKDAIIESYVSVMGLDKWESLTDNEKNAVLHIVLNDFAKAIEEV